MNKKNNQFHDHFFSFQTVFLFFFFGFLFQYHRFSMVTADENSVDAYNASECLQAPVCLEVNFI